MRTLHRRHVSVEKVGYGKLFSRRRHRFCGRVFPLNNCRVACGASCFSCRSHSDFLSSMSCQKRSRGASRGIHREKVCHIILKSQEEFERPLTYVANAEWPEKRPTDCIISWGLSSSPHPSTTSFQWSTWLSGVARSNAAGDGLSWCARRAGRGCGRSHAFELFPIATYYGRVG